jgi:hypothetical protein
MINEFNRSFDKVAAAVKRMAQQPLVVGKFSQHFNSVEFRCGLKRGCIHCDGAVFISPNLIMALEEIRRRIERPLTIYSGYRCTEHNADINGAPQSQHVLGNAADLGIPEGFTIDRFAGIVQTTARQFSGGVGVYRKSRFIHIDLRYLKPDRRW